jgi:hypothetical protein
MHSERKSRTTGGWCCEKTSKLAQKATDKREISSNLLDNSIRAGTLITAINTTASIFAFDSRAPSEAMRGVLVGFMTDKG